MKIFKNKVRFEYWKYYINGDKIDKKIVSTPTVSPYAIIYDKQQFYMLAIKDGNNEFFHYRLDRIKNITETNEKVTIKKTEKSIEEYTDTAVEIFSGNEIEIEARCNEILLGEVIEKFGKNVKISPINQKEFKINLYANPQGFKLWAMRNLDIVTVIKPKEVIDEIQALLNDAIKRYGK